MKQMGDGTHDEAPWRVTTEIDSLLAIAPGATLDLWKPGQKDRNGCSRQHGFLKAARKACIADVELCVAIRQVMLGQADDLGGGVFKKRLGKNLYRSIIVAKGGRYWVYEYLSAKKNRANIEDDDLAKLERISLWCRAVLKGRGFNRAARCQQRRVGL